MESANRTLAVSMLILVLACAFSGCNGKKERTPQFDIVGNPPDCVLALSTGDKGSEDSMLYAWRFPENRLLWSGSRDEVLSIWDRGMLYLGKDGVGWWDLNVETLAYEPASGVDVTWWNKPIAVGPENRIIYTFGHTVEPMRSIQAHYLDGRNPEDVNEFVADIVELPDMLPSNGWQTVYLDRPGQANASTPEKQPTRRLRILSEGTMAGEFTDILGLFPLDGCVVLHQEQGWFLLDPGDWRGIVPRSMSIGDLEGDLRPVARDGHDVIIADDLTDEEDEDAVQCTVYRYGIYSREADQIWDTGKIVENSTIVAADTINPDDYLFVLASNGNKKLTVVRLNQGNAEELCSCSLQRPFREAFVFALTEPEVPEVEIEAPVEESTSEPEPVM
jgi:hypothetical protein